MAYPTNGDPNQPDVPFQWEPSDHYAHPWADSQVKHAARLFNTHTYKTDTPHLLPHTLSPSLTHKPLYPHFLTMPSSLSHSLRVSQPLWSPCPELVHGNILTVSQVYIDASNTQIHTPVLMLIRAMFPPSSPPSYYLLSAYHL